MGDVGRAFQARLRGPKRAALHVLAIVFASALVSAQAADWPTYHGDDTGQRHSRLTQITPENVSQLTLAWSF